MPNRLIQLLADNRKTQGRKFEVVAAANEGEADVYVYDAIVSSTLEAEWWGGVDAQTFVKALRGIDADVINLRIDSPGGSVFAARAMETALREHKAQVVVHVDGLAASAASFLAMAGDEIRMAPGAMMMIHKAWSVAVGDANDMLDQAALLEKIDGTLVTTYAERTGLAPEAIAQMMADETWMTADEAVAHGFADTVKEFAPQARLSWNLQAIGRVQEEEPYASEEHRARQAQRVALLNRIG